MDLHRADTLWTPCHGIVDEAEFDNTCSPGRGSIPAFGGFAPNPPNRFALNIRLHELVLLQETTIVDIANKSELFTRILHREHVIIAFFLSVLLARIRIGKISGWSVMEENRVHNIKEV